MLDKSLQQFEDSNQRKRAMDTIFYLYHQNEGLDDLDKRIVDAFETLNTTFKGKKIDVEVKDENDNHIKHEKVEVEKKVMDLLEKDKIEIDELLGLLDD